MTGYYGLRYPDRVNRLIFMSAVGINSRPDWAQMDSFRQAMKNSCLATYAARYYEHKIEEISLTPFDLVRTGGRFISAKITKRGLMQQICEDSLT